MLYEKQYLSPRQPPKISLRHDLNWSKGNDQGSTVDHQPVGKLVQQSLGEALQPGSSKPTQFPEPIEDRTGQPVTQEIVGKLQGELSSSDSSGQPDRQEEKRVLKRVPIERGNLLREDCTQCKKMVISKILMTRISSTLRWMTRTLISTSLVFPMRRWNALKALAFMT